MTTRSNPKHRERPDRRICRASLAQSLHAMAFLPHAVAEVIVALPPMRPTGSRSSPDATSPSVRFGRAAYARLSAYLKFRPSGKGLILLWECEEISDLVDMSTSIVRIYSQDGFVVAADGREYDPKNDGDILSDNVRKIFPINDPGRSLLYALSGTSKLTLADSDKSCLDLLRLVQESVSRLAKVTPRSLWHYAEALSRTLEYFPEHGDETEPTVMYLDGYYDSRPKRAKITINYDG